MPFVCWTIVPLHELILTSIRVEFSKTSSLPIHSQHNNTIKTQFEQTINLNRLINTKTLQNLAMQQKKLLRKQKQKKKTKKIYNQAIHKPIPKIPFLLNLLQREFNE
jgi:hypothetical protein